MRLFPIREIEVDGIQMGVLSDGTPYLTMRGLARMCGIDNPVLLRLANNWQDEQSKPRGKKLLELLKAQGHSGESLYLRTVGPGGETHAYPDAACMALLEYYAFESAQADNGVALRNYRLLARSTFREYIYKRVGYDPDAHIPESWRTYHDRILLNDQVPIGYFSIFRESADVVVHMIKAGCPFDEHTVPDISIGKAWAKHWGDEALENDFGERRQHPHIYPDWFPQAAANPVDCWIYPVGSLGIFKDWLYRKYLPTAFPKYIETKVRKGTFLPSRAEQVLASVRRPQLR